jgi:hypothetical protein
MTKSLGFFLVLLSCGTSTVWGEPNLQFIPSPTPYVTLTL